MKRAVLILAAASVAAAACQRRVAPPLAIPPQPAPAAAPTLSTWPVTLGAALRAAEAGDYAAADRLLLEHGLTHPGSSEGEESDFWRAVLRADPANAGVSARERVALFDAYLASVTGTPRTVEATVMRRLLESADSLAAVLSTVRTNSEQRLRAREEEVRRLSDELDRTSAELERIRKRLVPAKG